MGVGAGRRVWIVAIATALILVASAVIALAEAPLPPGPPLSVVVANYSAGTVRVSVEVSSGLSAVGFFDGAGTQLVTRVVEPTDTVVGFDLPLRADTVVHAVGYNAAGTRVWDGAPTMLARSAYAPKAPKLAIADRTLVGSMASFKGSAFGGRATTMTVLVRGVKKWRGAVTASDGAYAMPPVSMGYGRSTASIVAENGFGRAQSPGVDVYNLGKVPAHSRYVLVDKSDLLLYWVRNNRVVRVHPVAIGMRATPTRTGTFKLGPAQKASGSYGVLRMPLLKLVNKKYRPTSYYIHGTNAPWSIGTMASMGCVRMFNSHVTALSKIAVGFPAVIRE